MSAVPWRTHFKVMAGVVALSLVLAGGCYLVAASDHSSLGIGGIAMLVLSALVAILGALYLGLSSIAFALTRNAGVKKVVLGYAATALLTLGAGFGWLVVMFGR